MSQAQRVRDYLKEDPTRAGMPAKEIAAALDGVRVQTVYDTLSRMREAAGVKRKAGTKKRIASKPKPLKYTDNEQLARVVTLMDAMGRKAFFKHIRTIEHILGTSE